MAVDATARLYDVDEDTTVFERLDKTKQYDQGVVTFRARKGKLIDLDKLHESLWATRLSGGTRSGLVSLKVTTIGKLVSIQGGVFLKVPGDAGEFMLGKFESEDQADSFSQLVNSDAVDKNKTIKVTGVIDNYKGRWPSLLKKSPDKVRRILVTSYKVLE